MSNADRFLTQKVIETREEFGVPALAATVVAAKGAKIAAAQEGIRKVGASGAQNVIKPSDQFNLGSVSKVVTGYLMAKLIQDSTGDLEWGSTIGSVFPTLASLPGWQSAYANSTMQQLLAHTAGFPYSPSTDDVDDCHDWTESDLTPTKIKNRRMKYVKAAVIDPPPYTPGGGLIYDGGGVICAAMAETKTGKTYEELVASKVFAPLSMNNSGFGRLSKGALAGPWQHLWDAETLQIKPDTYTMKIGNDGHPRMPVGGVNMSAKDMALFLREQVTDTPKVCDKNTRRIAQTRELTGSFAAGGWGMSTDKVTQISHNGDNGRSYAEAAVLPEKGEAYAAMCNMNNIFAGGAVAEMNNVSRFMLRNWELFEDADESFAACVHPCPAVAAGGDKEAVFARKHDGSVWVKRSANGGEKWTVFKKLPQIVITSGLAACASNNGAKLRVFGRGPDNRIWRCHSTDGGVTWQDWVPIRNRVFETGPAAAADSDGSTIEVVAIGQDRKMYRSRSEDAGESWSEWAAIGAGVFTSAPAIALSDTGETVHVFGRGNDWRIWRNRSTNGGRTWNDHWAPIGNGIATSSPAAAVSGDGRTVHVASRGCDSHTWRNTSRDSGVTWLPNWRQVPNGTFTSAPALATNDSGSAVRIVALGGDFAPYRNTSSNSGDDWSGDDKLGSAGDFFA